MSTDKNKFPEGTQNVGQFSGVARSIGAKVKHGLGRFNSDRSGAVAMIFALLTPIVFALVGGAVDIGRWISTRDATLRAMDAAVLAAGRSMQINNTAPADALLVAQQFFEKNKPSTLSMENVTFSLAENDTVIIAVSDSSINTPFLSVTGIKDMAVKARSKAVLAANGNAGTNIEISMMLDTTGSMDWNSSSGTRKMDDLKAAAKDLVDIVVWDNQSSYKSRIALAPFAARVNVGQYFQDMTGYQPSNSSRTCIEERVEESKLYVKGNATAQNRRFRPYWGWCTPSSPIMPLSSDKTALKAAIDALPASGGTAGHLGIGWSWYLLSPSFNTYWPNTSNADPYAHLGMENTVTVGDATYTVPKLKKIAVLMTDGEFNTWHNGPSSNEQAETLCNKMKNDGIEIYSVAFDVGTSGPAYDIMSGCASSPEHFYPAENGNALKAAFRDIGLKVASLRLAE